MALRSSLFAKSRELQACLTDDRAHVMPGAKGTHVQLIQRGLVMLGDQGILRSEYIKGLYGPTTASAVLSYKSARSIINYSYQNTPDNIVGKMTIRSLDEEVRYAELASFEL